jgi:hypothetical protein
MLKKPENVASSFDRLRMRSSVFSEFILMASYPTPHGELVEPWTTSFFSGLLAL